MVRKFLDDRAANLAALIAFYAFFSVFPLLLALVSVLGFVLEDDPTLREDIVDSTLAQLPVLGSQVAGAAEPLTGSGIALAVGILGALWAGLGVTVALGRAFEVDRFDRADPSGEPERTTIPFEVSSRRQ